MKLNVEITIKIKHNYATDINESEFLFDKRNTISELLTAIKKSELAIHGILKEYISSQKNGQVSEKEFNELIKKPIGFFEKVNI